MVDSDTWSSAAARARDSFERRAWRTAADQYAGAARIGRLEPDDTRRRAIAAHLAGEPRPAIDLLAGEYSIAAGSGDPVRTRTALFWLALICRQSGRPAQAAGWLAEAEPFPVDAVRPSDQATEPAAEIVAANALIETLRVTGPADGVGPAIAAERLDLLDALAARHGRRGLSVLVRAGRAATLLATDDREAALDLLDRLVPELTDPAVPAAIVGSAFCSAVETATSALDVDRAARWTVLFSSWCDEQPELVAFRGNAQLFRAQALLRAGSWAQAWQAARSAEKLLAAAGGGGQVAGAFGFGAAMYLEGELHRLAGRLLEADRAYRFAGRVGQPIEPGWALLRMAQGDRAAALDAVQIAVRDAQGSFALVPLLWPQVQIAVAGWNLPTARAAAERLREIAERFPSAVLVAGADTAIGAVLNADRRPDEAEPHLLAAERVFAAQQLTHELEQTRALLGAVDRLRSQGWYRRRIEQQRAARTADAARETATEAPPL